MKRDTSAAAVGGPVPWVLATLSSFPPALIVIFISMMPIVELRGTILLWSVQDSVFTLAGLPYPDAWLEVYVLAVIGNLIPIPFLLLFFPRVEKWLRRWAMFDRFFNRLFARTRRKASASVEKRGSLALLLFVAIPLPITGAWTGSLVSYLFGLDIQKSFIFITMGVLIAGMIMLAMVLISPWLALAVIAVFTAVLLALGR